MAKVSSVNLTPATGAEAMYQLMVFLRDQMGFTITISGDGLLAFNNLGASVITSGSTGSNGMGNTNSYFVAQDPDGVYEWCIQRSTTNISWEVVTSTLDGFTGGSATVRPTAADENVLINTTLFSTDNTYRWHITGDTAAIGVNTSVYPWRAFAVAGSIGKTILGHEPLEPGSYPQLVGTRAVPITGEPDPSLHLAHYDTNGYGFALDQSGSTSWPSDTSGPAQGVYCMNGVNGQTEAFVRFQGCIHYAGGDNTPGNLGVDARTSQDPVFKILMVRSSRVANSGPKGVTATILGKGTDRAYPNVMEIAGSRYVCIRDLLIPFEDGTLPRT